MVDVAQLVRVPDCDSGCCRFESGHPPENSRGYSRDFFCEPKRPRRNARSFVLGVNCNLIFYAANRKPIIFVIAI